MLTVLIKMPTWKMNLRHVRVKTKRRTTVGLLDRQWTYIFGKLIQCLRNINHFCAWSNSCASMHVNMKKWSDRSFQPAVVVRNAVHVFLSHLCYCGQYYITTTLHLDFTFYHYSGWQDDYLLWVFFCNIVLWWALLPSATIQRHGNLRTKCLPTLIFC